MNSSICFGQALDSAENNTASLLKVSAANTATQLATDIQNRNAAVANGASADDLQKMDEAIGAKKLAIDQALESASKDQANASTIQQGDPATSTTKPVTSSEKSSSMPPFFPSLSPPQQSQQQNSPDNSQASSAQQSTQSDNTPATSADQTPATTASSSSGGVSDQIAALAKQIQDQANASNSTTSSTTPTDPNAAITANDQTILDQAKANRLAQTQNDLQGSNNNNTNTNLVTTNTSTDNNGTTVTQPTGNPLNFAQNSGNNTAAFQNSPDPNSASSSNSYTPTGNGSLTSTVNTGSSGASGTNGNLTITNGSGGFGGLMSSNSSGGSANSAPSPSLGSNSTGLGFMPDDEPNNVPTLPGNLAKSLKQQAAAQPVTPAATPSSNSFLTNMLWSIGGSRSPASITNPWGTILGGSVHP